MWVIPYVGEQPGADLAEHVGVERTQDAEELAQGGILIQGVERDECESKMSRPSKGTACTRATTGFPLR